MQPRTVIQLRNTVLQKKKTAQHCGGGCVRDVSIHAIVYDVSLSPW
jgi:hypothetical protein